MRKLLLHVGAGKTGTSALQLFFERHREWLARHRVRYPAGPHTPDPSTLISSGNGGWLFGFVRSGDYWPEVVGQLTSDDGSSDVLISSELLAHAKPDRIRELRDRLATLGFELRPFYLVRNPDEWYLSAYQQNVKRHGYHKTFVEFSRSYPLEFRTAVDHYEAVLGEHGLHLLSYEAGKADIVGYVLREALGIAAEPPSRDNPSINRSLTGYELNVMRLANLLQRNAAIPKETIDRRGVMFSDLLLSCRPAIARSDKYREPMPNDVVERLQPAVDAINARLAEGPIDWAITDPPVAVSPDALEAAYFSAAQLIRSAEFAEAQETASQQLDRLSRAVATSELAQQREAALAAEVRALRSSTSWRITAPLRAATLHWRELTRT